MSHFKRTPEFEKEYKKLIGKYRSLDQDIATFEKVISQFPTGRGSKFVILHSGRDIQIVKARLMCRTLRGASLRVIYAYHESEITFVYIEVYYKGDTASEDYERVKDYIREYQKKFDN